MDIKDVKVGYWVSNCCYLDLYEIETEEDLKEELEKYKDYLEEDLSLPDYFKNKLEALLYFRKIFNDKDSLDEIEVLINKELLTKK